LFMLSLRLSLQFIEPDVISRLQHGGSHGRVLDISKKPGTCLRMQHNGKKKEKKMGSKVNKAHLTALLTSLSWHNIHFCFVICLLLYILSNCVMCFCYLLVFILFSFSCHNFSTSASTVSCRGNILLQLWSCFSLIFCLRTLMLKCCLCV